MGDITVTTDEVALVRPAKAETWNVILASGVDEGDVLCQTAAGTFAGCDVDLAGYDEPRGVALEAGSAGQTISMVKRGAIYGVDLSGESYDGLVYASDTPGNMSDVSKAEIVGRVIALTDPDKTKVLYVDMPYGDADLN